MKLHKIGEMQRACKEIATSEQKTNKRKLRKNVHIKKSSFAVEGERNSQRRHP